MRFVSWNVNGLRAAIRKGIDVYFEELNADVMMLQETHPRGPTPQGLVLARGWHITLHPAEKKGYSGVATGTTEPHTVIQTGKGGTLDPDDLEGRSCHRSWRCGLHQHLPAKRVKQRRTATLQGGVDGRMANVHPALP